MMKVYQRNDLYVAEDGGRKAAGTNALEAIGMLMVLQNRVEFGDDIRFTIPQREMTDAEVALALRIARGDIAALIQWNLEAPDLVPEL